MTLHIYKDLEQRSDEWYKARCGLVTASAVGRLLTPTLRVADNEASRGLTAQLVAERITGQVEPTFMTDDMFRGVTHEPYARDIYSGYYQQAVECGFMRFDGDGWSLGYSPDGLVGDTGLLEVKCPRAKSHIQYILSDRVPSYYMAQLQAGLLVTGREWIDFVSFCAGQPLFVKRVHPDPDWFAAITAACIAFESSAAAQVAEYAARSHGLPVTERLDLDVVA
jgi:putative phage-type endonuclease